MKVVTIKEEFTTNWQAMQQVGDLLSLDDLSFFHMTHSPLLLLSNSEGLGLFYIDRLV